MRSHVGSGVWGFRLTVWGLNGPDVFGREVSSSTKLGDIGVYRFVQCVYLHTYIYTHRRKGISIYIYTYI